MVERNLPPLLRVIIEVVCKVLNKAAGSSDFIASLKACQTAHKHKLKRRCLLGARQTPAEEILNGFRICCRRV
jgi:hypothetical protein